jgi:hypothetical protein
MGTRTRLLTAAALLSGVLVAGCGGGSSRPTAAAPAGTTTSASSAANTTRETGAGTPPALAFSRCMRANGVPNFPDPTPNGNLQLHPGPGAIDPLSPAFNGALSKCQKLHPLPGVPYPGQATHPSRRALAQALMLSQCMRSHGISWFPDPRNSVPADASPARYAFIAEDNGAILAIPLSGLTTQGPAYYQAADACGIGSGNH